MSNRNNKRERLLTATDILLAERGINGMSLSDIAYLAEVPLGNVYYYFKTKESMIQDVLKIRFSKLKLDLIKIETESKNNKLRLQSFIKLFLGLPREELTKEIKDFYKTDIRIKSYADEPQSLGRFVSSLLLDIEKKQNNFLYNDFNPIMELIIGWCNKEFHELGEKSYKDKTEKFLNMLIGSCVLLLNSTIKTNSDKTIFIYIDFLINALDLKINQTESNITNFPDNKPITSGWSK